MSVSVPAAIRFHGQSPLGRQRYCAEHDWPHVRAECHTPTFGESAGEVLREARRRIEEITGLPPIYPDSPEWYAQMAAFLLCTPEPCGVGLPPCDGAALQRRLAERDEYRVEMPIIEWPVLPTFGRDNTTVCRPGTGNGRQFVRVSVQGCNTRGDIEALFAALRAQLGGA